MYSIHNTTKEEVQNQVVVEKSLEMMCMFVDLPYIDGIPRYDLQKDDHMVEIEVDCSKQPVLSSWEEEAQLSQCTDDNQILHTKQDCKKEDANFFPVNAECLPLCFAALLREHCKQIVSKKDEECSNASGEENKSDIEAVSDSVVQTLSLFEGQNSDETTKPGTGNKLIQLDSLPLCFSSFQTLRGNLGHTPVENHRVSHEVPIEPKPLSSEAFYDPIVDMLDSLCFQRQFSFTPNDFKNCYDMDMIRQSTPLSGSIEISVQNPLDEIQTYPDMLEDLKTPRVAQGQEVEWTVSKYQEIGQVYLDPIDIYMRKIFITQQLFLPAFLLLGRFIKIFMMMIRLTITFKYH
jgi:hypothetical protein